MIWYEKRKGEDILSGTLFTLILNVKKNWVIDDKFIFMRIFTYWNFIELSAQSLIWKNGRGWSDWSVGRGGVA